MGIETAHCVVLILQIGEETEEFRGQNTGLCHHKGSHKRRLFNPLRTNEEISENIDPPQSAYLFKQRRREQEIGLIPSLSLFSPPRKHLRRSTGKISAAL